MAHLKGRAKLGAAAVFFLLGGFVMYSAAENLRQEPAGTGPSHPGHARVYNIETFRAFDAGDERQLVGFADNVFVGRVTERVGSEAFVGPVPESRDSAEGPPATTPRTQFSVEVLDEIKGTLPDTVTVSQQGGRVEQDAVALVEGDPILQPGQTVLFATRFDEREGWHQITSAKYGDVRIEGPEERARVVDTFEDAEENQIDPLAAP